MTTNSSEIQIFDKAQKQSYDEFQLTDFLGYGTYGNVYSGINYHTKEKVALKVFKNNRPAEDLDRQIVQELAVLSNLNHKNLCNLVSSRFNGSLFYQSKEQKSHALIFELASNGELYNLIQNVGFLTESSCLTLFKDLLSGLKYLKSENYCHRDIKLENLLLDQDYNLKLCDFGFAASTLKSKTLSKYCGSLSYMSPEMHLEKPYIGEKIDVFSAGIVLFSMATGGIPFENSKLESKYYRMIRRGLFKEFWEYHQKINKVKLSQGFKELLWGMLQFNPAQRFSIEQIQESDWIKNGIESSREELRVESLYKKDKHQLFDSDVSDNSLNGSF